MNTQAPVEPKIESPAKRITVSPISRPIVIDVFQGLDGPSTTSDLEPIIVNQIALETPQSITTTIKEALKTANTSFIDKTLIDLFVPKPSKTSKAVNETKKYCIEY